MQILTKESGCSFMNIMDFDKMDFEAKSNMRDKESQFIMIQARFTKIILNLYTPILLYSLNV